MTYMFLLNCALKLVEEIILYYDARSKKHQITVIWCLYTQVTTFERISPGIIRNFGTLQPCPRPKMFKEYRYEGAPNFWSFGGRPQVTQVTQAEQGPIQIPSPKDAFSSPFSPAAAPQIRS